MNDEPSLLISAYLDGELSDEQQARLAAWLRQNPANVDRFVVECRCHSGLLQVRAHLGRTDAWLAARRRRSAQKAFPPPRPVNVVSVGRTDRRSFAAEPSAFAVRRQRGVVVCVRCLDACRWIARGLEMERSGACGSNPGRRAEQRRQRARQAPDRQTRRAWPESRVWSTVILPSRWSGSEATGLEGSTWPPG